MGLFNKEGVRTSVSEPAVCTGQHCQNTQNTIEPKIKSPPYKEENLPTTTPLNRQTNNNEELKRELLDLLTKTNKKNRCCSKQQNCVQPPPPALVGHERGGCILDDIVHCIDSTLDVTDSDECCCCCCCSEQHKKSDTSMKTLYTRTKHTQTNECPSPIYPIIMCCVPQGAQNSNSGPCCSYSKQSYNSYPFLDHCKITADMSCCIENREGGCCCCCKKKKEPQNCQILFQPCIDNAEQKFNSYILRNVTSNPKHKKNSRLCCCVSSSSSSLENSGNESNGEDNGS